MEPTTYKSERTLLKSIGMLLVVRIALVFGVFQAPNTLSASIDESIDSLEANVKSAVWAYMADYPAGNNDPNPVRRRFLGLGPTDAPGGTDHSAILRGYLDQALILRQQYLTPPQLDRLSRTINLALEVSLQGWLICGNVSLLEGLRITYPSSSENQLRPRSNPLPFGCIEEKFGFVVVKDVCRAQHFYSEGVRALAAVLSGHPGNSHGQVVVDVDFSTILPPTNSLPGAFENQNFPQYTYYVDNNKVIPIQTEAAMMGHLLRKQAQATQTIGYRLWTSAYFDRTTQRDPAKRKELLDAAVKELHAGANLQFLSSVALAAHVGDQALVGAETPFDLTKIRDARANITEARSVIDRIRKNEKPALAIDEVMAGDQQLSSLIQTISGTGAGSISRARTSYETAKNALWKVRDNAVDAFNDEQTRQNNFFPKLTDLTGITVDATAIRTAPGQDIYRREVAALIDNLMNDPGFRPPDSLSALAKAISEVRFHRQEVLNKWALVISYIERVRIVEDTLLANSNAISAAEGDITAYQAAIGNAQAWTITTSASTTYSFKEGWSFSAGVSASYNPSAEKIAGLQNDITRASNLKEMSFLQNSAAEQCRSLLLDQGLARGELASQIILLRNAEDAVNGILGAVDRILAQLKNFELLTATLYYNDPTFNLELTAEEEQANRDMDSVVGNLYKLGRLLEQRWLEPFYNPVSNPGNQPISLGPDFERFWSLESVFSLGTVNVRDSVNPKPPWEQAADFYSALREWDNKLRSGIRAFDGDLGLVEISMREDVFEYADVKNVDGEIVPLDTNPFTNPDYLNDAAIRDGNVRRFRNLLLNYGRYLLGPNNPPVASKYRGFLLPFQLSYYDVGFTGGKLGAQNLFPQINAWNYRLAKFKVKVIPAAGKDAFSGQSSTSIIFAQAGLVSNIDYFERTAGRVNAARRVREFNLDNYVRYNRESLNLSENGGPYLLFSLAKQNSFLTDAEIPTASNMVDRYWSPFCSRWLLEFVPENFLEVENIDDIVLELTLKSGVPGFPLPALN